MTDGLQEDNVKSQRECHVTAEAEIKVTQSQAKGCQGLMATPEAKRKTCQRFFFLETSGEHGPENSLISSSL